MQLTAVRVLTAPPGPPALMGSVSGSIATLTWTAPVPTGQSVIAGYRLYKGSSIGSVNTLLGTFAGLTATDTMVGTTFYRVEAFDQFTTGASSTVLSLSPLTNAVAHGDLVTLTASGFGTRPNYNFDGYQWFGRTHIHYRWCDFGTTFPASGSSQAAFLAALNGLQPIAAFDFQGNTASIQLTQQTGGVSQSQRFFQRPGYAFASEGGLGFETDNRVPTSMKSYACWKQRGVISGKIVRIWPNGWASAGGNNGDYYLGSGAAEREGNAWAYDAGAWYNNYSPSATVFQRHELLLDPDPAIQSRFYVNGTQITFGPYKNGVQQGPLSSVPLCLTTDNARGINGNGVWIEWPNAIDSGGTIGDTDLYFDWTPARVEVTDGSKTEIQIVNSWADTQIQFTFNKGELSPGARTVKVYNDAYAVIYTTTINIA